MSNSPKRILSQLPADTHGKLTMHSTWWCHQATSDKFGFEAESVRALGALPSLRSNNKHAAEKQQEMQFLSKADKEQWFDDYVERETAGARKRVDDAETAIKQEQEDMTNAENVGLTSRKPEKTFDEILPAMGDSLRYLPSSDDADNGQDEEGDEDEERGKLSENDEPCWVIGTISKTVQQHMERFAQRQVKLDELTQPGRG